MIKIIQTKEYLKKNIKANFIVKYLWNHDTYM